MEYQPACYQCRVDAGKNIAGVKEASLCFPHLQQCCADLTRQLSDEQAEADALRDNCDAQQQAIEHLTRQLEAALREIARLRKALEALILIRRIQIAVTCPGDHTEECSHGEEFDSIIQHIQQALEAGDG